MKGNERAAFRLLHVGYIALPTLAGLDKYLHVLSDWHDYLAPQVQALYPGTISAHGFMLIVGAIEMAAGLLVAVSPRIGGYVVAAWLLGIVVNLLLLGQFYDIALRDVGLSLGAVSLAQLATAHAHERGRAGRPLRAAEVPTR